MATTASAPTTPSAKNNHLLPAGEAGAAGAACRFVPVENRPVGGGGGGTDACAGGAGAWEPVRAIGGGIACSPVRPVGRRMVSLGITGAGVTTGWRMLSWRGLPPL